MRSQLKSYSIYQFEEPVLSKLEVRSIYVEDQPNMQISFDIVVNAEIVDKDDADKIFSSMV